MHDELHLPWSMGRLVEKQKVLAQEVSDLLAEAKTVDATEDAKFGPSRLGDGLPVELADRRARASLEEEAAGKARAEAEEKARDRGDDDITAAGDKAAKAAVPKPKAQRNFTDLDAWTMKRADGSFSYCYKGQAVVDEYRQVIVAAEYGTEFFISTGRKKHATPIPKAPRGRIPANATVGERMARKLKTTAGKGSVPGARPSSSRCSADPHPAGQAPVAPRVVEGCPGEQAAGLPATTMKLHSYREESPA